MDVYEVEPAERYAFQHNELQLLREPGICNQLGEHTRGVPSVTADTPAQDSIQLHAGEDYANYLYVAAVRAREWEVIELYHIRDGETIYRW